MPTLMAGAAQRYEVIQSLCAQDLRIFEVMNLRCFYAAVAATSMVSRKRFPPDGLPYVGIQILLV